MVIKMPLLRPDRIVESPAYITAQMLAKMGVKALLLDLDGTLAPSGEALPPAEIISWAGGLRQSGIKLFILSNNKSHERVRVFAAALGVPFAHLARKPRVSGYLSSARELGIDPCDIAMVGDQIFTDTLGANRAGVRSILVETLDTKRWYHRLRRIAEIPFRRERNIDNND